MNPRESALDRPVAMRLAETEYQRCTDVFRGLTADQWRAPTCCPAWDMRQLAAHMLGMVEMAASIRESLRQQRAAARTAARDGGSPLDALTGLQVSERQSWTPQQITARYAARVSRAVAGRRRTPGFIRGRTLPQAQDVNRTMEPWTFGYLTDVILTRDPWMHRMDIALATGTAPLLTADHDGVIVADVAAEWAARHGKDFSLTLTGPAGGAWHRGENGPVLEFDAIDFCRALGRRPAAVTLGDLMNTEVPY
jgi:uncharacterized protein (TIGR03083 family)